jgi:predicted nucleic acid-binding protein
MSEPAPTVICDAGPLIHLDELGCLLILDDFASILIPDQVHQEVTRHRAAALAKPSRHFQSINVTISSEPAFQSLVKSLSLDIGEQAALSLLQQNPQAMFLTDDAAARLAATTIGYRVHGTIGILIRAIRRHQLTKDEVISLLRQLPTQSTLHIRPSLLQEIITRLEDEMS